MLRFTKLEINNFGPYQLSQCIDFPTEDGVVIVWGENGFGKTTIMKALRYALWGNILDENDAEESIASYVNKEAIDRGEDMSIHLYMDYDGDKYVLTRQLKRRAGTSGENDYDYSFEVFLKKGNNIVSTVERDHFLNTAIPEDISRFYLFDGELLSQYESLLKSGNDNTIIKDSIEDILGLPILERSRDSLDIVRKQYSDNFNKVSTADSRTKQIGEKIAGLEEKEEELKKSIGELQTLLNKAVNELGSVDTRLSETETYRTKTKEIKDCEKAISVFKGELETETESLRTNLDNLWESHLKVVIDRAILQREIRHNELAPKVKEQNEEQVYYTILNHILEKYQDGCNCPICNSSISETSFAYMNEQMKKQYKHNEDDLQEEYSRIESEIRDLRSLKCENNIPITQDGLKRIQSLSDKIQFKEIEKSRLEEERRKVGKDGEESGIEALMPEHDRLTQLIQTYKDGISKAQSDIDENKVSIEKLRNQIKKNQSNTQLSEAQKELDLCQEVCDLFDSAIERFKQNLKENVQKDASTYFTSVSHNPDYTGLSINEEYGLEILTASGIKVPHRSSGYVQVVAISLIAALHRNAPISGPIIMDSTFQRIDPRHKQNILKSLPTLGRQVVVLAYPDEIQENVARNVLQGSLRKEVTLVQKSSFNTIIKQ